jgi:hypothetical protein
LATTAGVTTRIACMRGRSAAVNPRPFSWGGTVIERMRTAQNHDLLRAGQADVGAELVAPAQVPVILLARE